MLPQTFETNLAAHPKRKTNKKAKKYLKSSYKVGPINDHRILTAHRLLQKLLNSWSAKVELLNSCSKVAKKMVGEIEVAQKLLKSWSAKLKLQKSCSQVGQLLVGGESVVFD